jgi:hypothetical protein
MKYLKKRNHLRFFGFLFYWILLCSPSLLDKDRFLKKSLFFQMVQMKRLSLRPFARRSSRLVARRRSISWNRNTGKDLSWMTLRLLYWNVGYKYIYVVHIGTSCSVSVWRIITFLVRHSQILSQKPASDALCYVNVQLAILPTLWVLDTNDSPTYSMILTSWRRQQRLKPANNSTPVSKTGI